ncbi:hypothetical protein ACFPA8_06495 [Streptomyces ovatisporus]|uniref:Uncharacterized protein n=1 Tax=Streptomyces ovatisporus TaxID=1128682 RepID=A0ABV9A8B1_9ACTN
MQADELRFADEPLTAVRFEGSPGRESVSLSERTNLPDRVEAGTDYRDVHVDYRLATRLRDRDGTADTQTETADPQTETADPENADPQTAGPGTADP